MKQKIILLMIAICMAMVARPQTLVSQKTEKVFDFKNKMAVLKTRVIKTFEYQRSVPDTGYELIGSGDADLLPLRDICVYEKMEASFPVKSNGFARYFDTSHFRKAYLKAGEEIFTERIDTMNIFRSYFFYKDIVIRRYSVVFDEGGFTLTATDEKKTESMADQMLFVLLLPIMCIIAITAMILAVILSQDGLQECLSVCKKLGDLRGNYIKHLFYSVVATTLVGGMFFGLFFYMIRGEVLIDISTPLRVFIVIVRIFITYVAIAIIFRGIRLVAIKNESAVALKT